MEEARGLKPKQLFPAIFSRHATAYQRRLAAAEDAEIMAKLDPARNEVIHLTDAERAAFMRAVRPVLEKYRHQLDPNQIL